MMPARIIRIPAIALAWLAAVTVAAEPGTVRSDDSLPPPVIHICLAHCGTWYLTQGGRGYSGTPQAPDPTPGGYGVTITRFDAGGVQLDRYDPPNMYFAHGLKAVITGQIAPEGNRVVNGKIQWTFGQTGMGDARIAWGSAIDTVPGGGEPSRAAAAQSASARAPLVEEKFKPLVDRLLKRETGARASKFEDVGNPAPSEPTIGQLPMQLVVCEAPFGPDACAGFKWDGHYYRPKSARTAAFGVQQWHSGGVVLTRTDGHGPADGVHISYQGHWQSDGTLAGSITRTLPGTATPDPKGTVISGWSAAVDPDAALAHVTCSEQHPPDGGDLEALSQRAMEAGDLVSMACFIHALAKQGNPVWQAAYGSHLLNGYGVARSPEDGFAWTLKAAGQGNEAARYLLRDLYTNGIGTPRDAAKAAAVDDQLRDGAAQRLTGMLDRAYAQPSLPNLMVEAARTCEGNPDIAKRIPEQCAAALRRANIILRRQRLDDCHREAKYSTGGHAVIDPRSGRDTGRTEGAWVLEDAAAYRQCAANVDAEFPDAAAQDP